MNYSNTKTAGLKYELAGSKKPNIKAVMLQSAEQLPSINLIWLLVKRHKVSLLAIGNIVLLLNYAIPQWPSIVRSVL